MADPGPTANKWNQHSSPCLLTTNSTSFAQPLDRSNRRIAWGYTLKQTFFFALLRKGELPDKPIENFSGPLPGTTLGKQGSSSGSGVGTERSLGNKSAYTKETPRSLQLISMLDLPQSGLLPTPTALPFCYLCRQQHRPPSLQLLPLSSSQTSLRRNFPWKVPL